MPTTFLDAAVSIGRELAVTAVDEGGSIGWTGDDLVGTTTANARIVRGPIGHDLYGGAAGVGWFLAHLAAATRDHELRATAAEAIYASLAHAEEMRLAKRHSLHSGATGVAIAALESGQRLGDEGMQRAGYSVALEIAADVRTGSLSGENDLIGGLSGVISGLLAAYRFSGEPALLNACRAGCERLLAGARREWWGWSWPEHPEAAGRPALCGLAHGASGVALALAETGWVTQEERYLEAADEALRYERSWFSPERCEWPDLRQPEDEAETLWPGWVTAWCHGAIGIGIVRLRLHQATKDLTALAEATAAIQSTRLKVMQAGAALARGHVQDVTLCHGLSGAVELFRLAHEVLEMPEHLRAAQRVGDLILKIRRMNGEVWPLGLQGTTLIPGLFLGIAGVGAALLRLHDATLAPSPALPGYSVMRQASVSA